MKKLLIFLFTVISFAAFSQQGAQPVSGIFFRVYDSAAYNTAAANRHAQDYHDIYWNEQATVKHWDVWNGSSYDHVFGFNNGSGGGGSVSDWGDIGGTLSDQTDLQAALDDKQDALVSGTNIKTVNSTSLLGSGNLAVGDITFADLMSSRTMTSGDDLDQTDNFRIVFTDSPSPFNVTVDLLS